MEDYNKLISVLQQEDIPVDKCNAIIKKLQLGGRVWEGYQKFPSYDTFVDYLNNRRFDIKGNKVNTDTSGYDYNLKEFYEDPEAFDIWYRDELQNPGYAHMLGKYKKPNHMTYEGPNGQNWKELGGVWHYYVPQTHMVNGIYGHSFQEYEDYWKANEGSGSVLHYGDRTYSNPTFAEIPKHQKGGNIEDSSSDVQFEEQSIKIGDKTYNVKIAETEEQHKLGLQNVKSLDKNEGMLFVFNAPGQHNMWMKNTLIPLDQIFINEDFEVIDVVPRAPQDETNIGFPDTQYVLEVGINSGIKKGDILSSPEDADDNEYVMKVLAPDGSTQMELQGGERIVSRRETKLLIQKAKRANRTKKDRDYISLGRYMFRILKGQDNREPEYVNNDKKD